MASSTLGACRGRNIIAVAVACVFVLPSSSLSADDRGQFDGAVWNFEMTPKGKKAGTLKSKFRVSDNVIYQPKDPKDKDAKKKVGTNHPNSDSKTKIILTDLRAFTKNRVPRSGLSGVVYLKRSKFGEWSGIFTDKTGRNWNFRCVRVKE